MKYCPNCGAEYLARYGTCRDCQVPLVDEPPDLAENAIPTMQERVVVFRTGRRIDAELVRARLEADGLQARIWSGGLGVWRMESALTEVTGVPNAFNAHQVVVSTDDEERALEILEEVSAGREESAAPDEFVRQPDTLLAWLRRQRWLLLAFAILMLVLVFVFGPPGL